MVVRSLKLHHGTIVCPGLYTVFEVEARTAASQKCVQICWCLSSTLLHTCIWPLCAGLLRAPAKAG